MLSSYFLCFGYNANRCYIFCLFENKYVIVKMLVYDALHLTANEIHSIKLNIKPMWRFDSHPP